MTWQYYRWYDSTTVLLTQWTCEWEREVPGGQIDTPAYPSNLQSSNQHTSNQWVLSPSNQSISSMIENNMTNVILSSPNTITHHSSLSTHHTVITHHHYPLTHHTPENPYSKEYKARSKQRASKLSLMRSVTKQSSLSNCPHHHLSSFLTRSLSSSSSSCLILSLSEGWMNGIQLIETEIGKRN